MNEFEQQAVYEELQRRLEQSGQKKQMTLEYFLRLYTAKLIEFGSWWERKHAWDDETYPLEMGSASEWMEQFISWDEENQDEQQ